ncbi:MAG: hypothetical protein AAB354_05860 [candidate division KSB1 bacterium]
MSSLRSEYRRFVRQPYLWIGAALLLLLVAEMSFDLIEHALGRYMVWHNPGREKIGRSWKEGENRLLASTQLEQITRETRERNSAMASITTFSDLVDFLNANGRAVLAPEQFGVLYQNLPEFFRALVIPPEDLIALHQQQPLSNVLAERSSDRMELALLDQNNQAAYRCTLSNEQLTVLANHGKEIALEAHTTERLQAAQMSYQEFLNVLERKFVDDRTKLMRELPVLTDLGVNIQRVAFAQRSVAGFVETAFVLDDFHARIYYLPEEWISDFTNRSMRYEEPPGF